MLYRTPKIGDQERLVSKAVGVLWRQMQSKSLAHPPKWSGLTASMLRARAIQGSNSIEGHYVSVEDATEALLGGEPGGANQGDWLAVLHYREAMDYALTQSQSEDFTYSKDLVRGLHFMMLRHEPTRRPGLWRPGPIHVTGSDGGLVYTGPDADLVPDLMAEFVDSLEVESKHAASVRAAMAHLNLVRIHPFGDGNGRMSRCLQTLVLARAGVFDPVFASIEEYLGRNTPEYYAALAAVSGDQWRPRGADTLGWVRFCLKAHYQQGRSAERRLKNVSAVGAVIEAELARLGIDDRAAVPLVNAAMGDRIRNAAYRRDADVSSQVAMLDLRSLVEADLLIAQGTKRGRSYLASPRLREIAESERERGAIEDPFKEPGRVEKLMEEKEP